MGDAESAFPPSKKRAAGREISKDNPGLDDDDAPEQESGTFKKASDEVLATRRIVKVRRQQTPAAAHSNPFANISFVPPSTESAKPTEVIAKVPPVAEEDTKSTEKTDEPEVESAGEKGDSVNKLTNPESIDEKENGRVGETGEEAKKDNGLDVTAPSASTTPLSSFQQLSSNQNAFTGFSGPGFSNSAFSFSSTPKDGFGFGKGFPAFNFSNSGNGGSSLFGTAGTSAGTKSETSGKPSMPEVPVETGEENEKAVFTCDAMLFEYLEGSWKERGKGELKVNVSTTGPEKARLVMRAKGIYRLILNASLYPDMKFANMDKRGITFACMNSTGEGKDGLSTFALKFKDGSVVEEFRMNVMAHKGKTTAVLKTPENSPKASDE